MLFIHTKALCIHHFLIHFRKCKRNLEKSRFLPKITWARGFEPPTFWSVAKRSIQLSYAHILYEASQTSRFLTA